MHIPDHTRAWLIDFLQSNLFLQIAPLLIVVLVPAFVFLATTALHPARLYYLLTMGLESIGLTLSWVFSSNPKPHASAGTSRSSGDKKSKKSPRTRAEQVAQNGTAHHESKNEDEGYYPGLVNVSGTYCFMNSTLQALASLTYLQPHIDAINAKAEALDVPTPVIDALQELFRRLNKPHSSYHAIRPTDIIQVLSSQTEGRTNSLFYSREHQDAQELFQVVSECIKNEIAAVDKEAYRDRGLGGLANLPPETMRDIGKSVFDGLTANRRSCCVCGYTEAVMHFALDNWQLAVPRLEAVCRLEDCLADYTRLEILRDCICRKCSVKATLDRLKQEVLKLEHETGPDKKPSNSKKDRLKKVKRMEARVRKAIAEERIEEDLKDVRMEKVFSPASTKQAMIARPPPVLALHINRSVHYGHYASKNNVRLIFPEVLDLTPYTTSGNLSTVPTSAISTPPPALPRSTTPTPSTYSNPRIIYRLAAVVCHYGQHSFGHYICYRRKPRHPSVSADKRWAPPTIVDPIHPDDDTSSIRATAGSTGDSDVDLDTGSLMDSFGAAPRYVFEDEAVTSQPGKGWLRISDDAVRECGIETVLQEGSGAFMLYYERAVLDYSPYGPGSTVDGVGVNGAGSPRSSEETLRPELLAKRSVDLNGDFLLNGLNGGIGMNGSVGSLVGEVGVGVKHPQAKKPLSASGLDSSSRQDPTRTGRPAIASPIPIPIPTSGMGLGSATGLSTSLSQSQMLAVPGARIVRNVTTRRSRSAASRSRSSTEIPSIPTREGNGHVEGGLSSSSSIAVEKVSGTSIVNGLVYELSASAPSLVHRPPPPTSSSATATMSTSGSGSPGKSKHKSKSGHSRQHQQQQPQRSPSPSPSQQQQEPTRIHSPQPHHPPNGTPIVGLKA